MFDWIMPILSLGLVGSGCYSLYTGQLRDSDYPNLSVSGAQFWGLAHLGAGLLFVYGWYFNNPWLKFIFCMVLAVRSSECTLN